MSEYQDIHSELAGLANCFDFKYKQELTDEILSVNWDNYESAKPILDKYLNWLIDPVKYSLESRSRTTKYLEKALASDNFDFQEIVDYAEMAFDETKQGDPRKIFEAIYKFVSENE